MEFCYSSASVLTKLIFSVIPPFSKGGKRWENIRIFQFLISNKICMAKFKKNKKAFSLIEIMVAIAIIGIMSATVLVSLKSFGARGRSAKALAQISSALPAMISCAGNQGNAGVNAPSLNGTDDICNTYPSYGQWPKVGSGTDLSTYGYTSGFASGSFNPTSWYVYLQSPNSSGNDNVRVCCNSAMKGCKADVAGSNCTATVPGN